MKGRLVCGCGEPVRATGQFYCRRCQREKDDASAKRRRAELKRLRVEVKELRKALRRIRELAVAVPDEEC